MIALVLQLHSAGLAATVSACCANEIVMAAGCTADRAFAGAAAGVPAVAFAGMAQVTFTSQCTTFVGAFEAAGFGAIGAIACVCDNRIATEEGFIYNLPIAVAVVCGDGGNQLRRRGCRCAAFMFALYRKIIRLTGWLHKLMVIIVP